MNRSENGTLATVTLLDLNRQLFSESDDKKNDALDTSADRSVSGFLCSLG